MEDKAIIFIGKQRKKKKNYLALLPGGG